MKNHTLGNLLNSLLVVLGFCASLIAQGPAAPKSNHERLMATSEFAVFRIRLGPNEVTDLWRHLHPVLIMPTRSIEVLEQIATTQPLQNVKWIAHSGVTVLDAGDTHTLFNPQREAFVGVEIEIKGENTDIGLIPRFSIGAREQYWTIGRVRVGRHLLNPNESFPARDLCDGIVISSGGLLKIQEHSQTREVKITEGEAIRFNNETVVSNVGGDLIILISICSSQSTTS